MIRFNFLKSHFTKIDLLDSDTNEVLDTVETPIHSPLYTYLSAEVISHPRKVKILITPLRYDSISLSINDLELWYY